jgi:hypothetical protein
MGLPERGGFQFGTQVGLGPDLNPVVLGQIVHHFRRGHHVKFERVQGTGRRDAGMGQGRVAPAAGGHQAGDGAVDPDEYPHHLG